MEPDEHLSLENKGESLLEHVAQNVRGGGARCYFGGLEDDWVSRASFNPKTWGKPPESKIDFVCLCESLWWTGERR